MLKQLKDYSNTKISDSLAATFSKKNALVLYSVHIIIYVIIL